jgi:hypothetical protein
MHRIYGVRTPASDPMQLSIDELEFQIEARGYLHIVCNDNQDALLDFVKIDQQSYYRLRGVMIQIASRFIA